MFARRGRKQGLAHFLAVQVIVEMERSAVQVADFTTGSFQKNQPCGQIPDMDVFEQCCLRPTRGNIAEVGCSAPQISDLAREERTELVVKA